MDFYSCWICENFFGKRRSWKNKEKRIGFVSWFEIR